MLPPCNFYWFRLDIKHMAEPWLDQALMCSAYKSDINNISQFYEPASFIFSFFIYSMVSLPPITLLYITLSISSYTNVKAFQKLIQFHLLFYTRNMYTVQQFYFQIWNMQNNLLKKIVLRKFLRNSQDLVTKFTDF